MKGSTIIDSVKSRVTAAAAVLRGFFPNSRTGGRYGGFGAGSTFLPGSQVDWFRRAGVLWHNSVVAACLYYIADTFPEAPLVVRRTGVKGKDAIIEGHRLARLVARPNLEYSGADLWQATLLSLLTDGNAYWRKERNDDGIPVRLWYVPHWCIEPRWNPDGSEFIGHYEYRTDGASVNLAPADIVHFRMGLDPANPRKGMSRLKAVLREVCSDNEATTYTASLLSNMGTPGVIAQADTENGADLSDGAKQKLKSLWRALTRGDARGDILIVPKGFTISNPGFMTPEDMVLDKIRQVPESRICAALRVDPMVVSLSVGQGQRTYSNMREARELTFEGTIIPLQVRLADTLDVALLPDLSVNPDGEQVSWDWSEVRVLQDDQDALWKRVGGAWNNGILRRSEARSALGYDSTPEDEVFRTDLAGAAAAADDQGDDKDGPKKKPRPGDEEDEDGEETAKRALLRARERMKAAAARRRLEDGP